MNSNNWEAAPAVDTATEWRAATPWMELSPIGPRTREFGAGNVMCGFLEEFE